MDFMKGTVWSGRVWVSILLGLILFLGGGPEFGAREVPDKGLPKIVGPGDCGECHKAEVYAWRESKHSKTFKALPRKKKAKEIAGKMGIKRMKKESDCLSCHFTEGYKKGKLKAIAGISCESCHSPAKDWIKVHGYYGGKKVTREMEPPEHKAQRLAKMKAAGMIRPSEIYRLAENCFQCHTVPNEKLVNVGGHKAGSEFELVSWSQGEVRHNFFHAKGKKNEEASPQRKRMLYVVGRSLDLEYSLRGLAKATKDGKFATSMEKRVQGAIGKLKESHSLAPLPEIKEILATAGAVELKANNEAALLAAADKIAALARKLADTADGSKLAALDQVIPKADKYKGKPSPGKPGK